MRLQSTIVLAMVTGLAAAAQPEVKPQHSVEQAKALTLHLQFPGELDREAVVFIQFDILANGKTTNIKPLDEGFHEKRFVEAATQAIRTSTWQPRRVDGKAVDSLQVIMPFAFRIGDVEPGITNEFRAEADKVEALLQKGDYAGGEFHAQWMLSEKVKLTYEYAVLEAELAQAYAALGRTQDALRKVSMATARVKNPIQFLQLLDSPPPNAASNYLLDPRAVAVLLRLRMQLLAKQGLAMEAVGTYYELAGLSPLLATDQAAVAAALLTKQIRGNGELRGKIEVAPTRHQWRQPLTRHRFTLEKVHGDVSHLRLVCTAGSKDIEYAPGEEWDVPADLGTCVAEVEAEPGTTFEFVEFPDEPVSGAKN